MPEINIHLRNNSKNEKMKYRMKAISIPGRTKLD